MGQDKMHAGCGGLGSDPEAPARIEAPGRGGQLPLSAPHSVGQFDTMHGRPEPPDDDRTARTATIARAAVAAHRQGDDDTVRVLGEALLRRMQHHDFSPAEKALLHSLAERRRARTNGTDVSKCMRQIHAEAKQHVVAMIAAHTPVTYEDAVRAVEPD